MMIDVYKQGVEPVALKKLEDALAEFIAMNPPGNPNSAQQIEHTEGGIRVAMNRAGESGTAVMGAAHALLSFIRSAHGSRLHFREARPFR